MSRILLVDDDQGTLDILTNLLAAEAHDIATAVSGEAALELLKKGRYDLMISDVYMSPMDGLHLLKETRQIDAQLAALMITGYPTVEDAIEAMKNGAYDYLIKPYRIHDLMTAVHRALETHDAAVAGIQKHIELQYRCSTLIASSAAMKQVCGVIEHVASTNTRVFIFGEPGTHKTELAQAIHLSSSRRGGPFLPFNCSLLNGPQAKAELFGVPAGVPFSFTPGTRGLLERANGGTLFLDHVNRLAGDVQGLLLKALEDQAIAHSASQQKIPVDVRVVSASSDPMDKLIERNEFREDLFRKLSAVCLEAPPLRKRVEDILPLAYHTIRAEFGLDADLLEIDDEARFILESYAWPGNITELEDAIRAAMAGTAINKITVASLSPDIVRAVKSDPGASRHSRQASAYRCYHLKQFLQSAKEGYLRHVVASFDGDLRQAAKSLNLSLTDLVRKLDG